MQKMCEIKRVGALRGGRRVDCEKMCKIKRVRWRVECEKMCEIKRGGWRVECEKMCEIKKVGALRGQAEGGVRKNVQN